MKTYLVMYVYLDVNDPYIDSTIEKANSKEEAYFKYRNKSDEENEENFGENWKELSLDEIKENSYGEFIEVREIKLNKKGDIELES